MAKHTPRLKKFVPVPEPKKAHHVAHVARMAMETASCAFVGYETNIPYFAVICAVWFAVNAWLLLNKDVA